MRKIKTLLISMCLCIAATCVAVGCAQSNEVSSSSSEEESSIVTVTFDTCQDLYEGLKTNRPAPQELEKGDLVKEPKLVAAQNPNNYEFEAWYTTDLFETQWNFETDTVQADMTLYAKWVEGCRVNYYLTDGSTKELKRTVYVPAGGKAEKADAVAQGYQLLGYYLDEELTMEYDFSQPITSAMDIYVKRSEYVYMDAKFIKENFVGVAGGAGQNGSKFGGMTYVEDGEDSYVDVNFGYVSSKDAPDAHIILQNMDLNITKSQKIEITFKNPTEYVKHSDGGYNALFVYGTGKYEDKTPAIFEGATGYISAAHELQPDECDMTKDSEWKTVVFDLGATQYAGMSVWANSTYLNLLRVQYGYEFSADENDTHHLWIKSIKGVADDTYVGTEDTFADGFLSDVTEEDLNAAAKDEVYGFTFPNDRDAAELTINGNAYNTTEGLLVYAPYRSECTELTLRATKDKDIDLSTHTTLRLKVKNLGYIPELDIHFYSYVEETGKNKHSKTIVKLPSRMTDFETIEVSLGKTMEFDGKLLSMTIAVASLGIDNAYVLESVEFGEYRVDEIPGLNFDDRNCAGAENSDKMQVKYEMRKSATSFTINESGAYFERNYVNYAMHGYSKMALAYTLPAGSGITSVNVALTIDGVTVEYPYAVTESAALKTLEVALQKSGYLEKIRVTFVGTGEVLLHYVRFGFDKGLDFSVSSTIAFYDNESQWAIGSYDVGECATKLQMSALNDGKDGQMFYLAPAGAATQTNLKNIPVGPQKKVYVLYQNRGTGVNDPLNVRIYGDETETGGTVWANIKDAYMNSQQGMKSGEWAVMEIDLSDFAWEYISLIRIQRSGTLADLYVRAIIVA